MPVQPNDHAHEITGTITSYVRFFKRDGIVYRQESFDMRKWTTPDETAYWNVPFVVLNLEPFDFGVEVIHKELTCPSSPTTTT